MCVCACVCFLARSVLCFSAFITTLSTRGLRMATNEFNYQFLRSTFFHENNERVENISQWKRRSRQFNLLEESLCRTGGDFDVVAIICPGIAVSVARKVIIVHHRRDIRKPNVYMWKVILKTVCKSLLERFNNEWKTPK